MKKCLLQRLIVLKTNETFSKKVLIMIKAESPFQDYLGLCLISGSKVLAYMTEHFYLYAIIQLFWIEFSKLTHAYI